MSWIYELHGRESWTTCNEEYETMEQAIQAGYDFIQAEYPELNRFDVGEKVYPPIPKIYADDITQLLNDRMYDDVGEHAEDWLIYISKEKLKDLEEKINELIGNWINESGNQPTFYRVDNIETFYIEEGEEV